MMCPWHLGGLAGAATFVLLFAAHPGLLVALRPDEGSRSPAVDIGLEGRLSVASKSETDDLDPLPELDPVEPSEHRSPADIFGEPAMAAMVLGFIGWGIFLLYVFTYSDPQVEVYNIKILSSCIAIFCAVSIEHANLVGYQLLLIKLGIPHDPFSLAILPVFLLWFTSVSVSSYKLRRSHRNVVAAKSILAHVSAFMAITGFMDLANTLNSSVEASSLIRRIESRFYLLACATILMWTLTYMSTNIFHAFQGVIGHPMQLGGEQHVVEETTQAAQSAAQNANVGRGSTHADAAANSGGGSSTAPTGCVVKGADAGVGAANTAEALGNPSSSNAVARSDEAEQGSHGVVAECPGEEVHQVHGHEDHDEMEELVEEINEAEQEAISIALSYILRNMITMTILEACEIQLGMNWEFSNPNFCRAMMILVAVISILFAMILSLVLIRSWLERREADVGVDVVRFKLLLTAMGFVMTFVEWFLRTLIEDHTCQKALTAMIVTPLGCMLVIITDKMADWLLMSHGPAEDLIGGIGFMIGFAWEKAFGAAVHEVTHAIEHHYSWDNFEVFMAIMISVVTVAIMLPVWWLSILPRAMRKVPPRFVAK